MNTTAWYHRFATIEAAGRSPCLFAWASGIAADAEVIATIDSLPVRRRQPNLVLAAARLHGAEVSDYPNFRRFLLAHWPAIRATTLTLTTQTNEAGRCASLLPVLAALPQPLALIEIGASAGLCLYPDRYAYQYDACPPLGTGPPLLACRTTGPVPFPTALPRLAWRAGIDLHPLDVTDEDAMRWLETLVWPEQQYRRDRLRAAIAIARADPPRILTGDLNAALPALVAEAPADATLVVFHSAVLAYLPPAERTHFVATISRLPCHWLSNESADTFPLLRDRLPTPPDPSDPRFILALDGHPLARTGSHGESLDWLT